MSRCRACDLRLPRGCKEFCRRCVWIVSTTVAKSAPEVAPKPEAPAPLTPGLPFIQKALSRAA